MTVEKGRRSLDVMHKDASRFQATGGWGDHHFDGDSQTSVAPTETRTACFTCHSKRKDHDFVFSPFRRQVRAPGPSHHRLGFWLDLSCDLVGIARLEPWREELDRKGPAYAALPASFLGWW